MNNELVNCAQASALLGVTPDTVLKRARDDAFFPKRDKTVLGTQFFWKKTETEAYAKETVFKVRKKRAVKQGCETSALNNALAQAFIRCGGRYWLLPERLRAVGA